MLISTKGRYVTRMLPDIAQHQGDGYVSMKRIAERQGISKKYLEHTPNQCAKCGSCLTLPAWAGLDKAVHDYLTSVTLKSMLDQAGQP